MQPCPTSGSYAVSARGEVGDADGQPEAWGAV